MKAVAQWLLARRFEVPASQRACFAILLSQGGEFAFVVMAASLAAGVIDQRQASLVTLVVALSMVSTPLLLLVHRRLFEATARGFEPSRRNLASRWYSNRDRRHHAPIRL